ncbi:MAG: hypothetical protein DRI77_08125 [Chloroflexi bacterium]|nr:MAG: hypothetical protein DRI77_08125 [Chloroflexota bacterium]
MKNELEQPAWIETWGRRIEALNLSPLALLLIEIVRPFGFLGSQALVLAQPLLAGVADDARFRQVMALLDDPETLRRLEICLEGEEARA